MLKSTICIFQFPNELRCQKQLQLLRERQERDDDEEEEAKASPLKDSDPSEAEQNEAGVLAEKAWFKALPEAQKV